MKWQNRMDAVIKDVLGIECTCIVESDKSFSIYENNERLLRMDYCNSLNAHWKDLVKDAITSIIHEKIKTSIKKSLTINDN
jgi:hypothetical protein